MARCCAQAQSSVQEFLALASSKAIQCAEQTKHELLLAQQLSAPSPSSPLPKAAGFNAAPELRMRSLGSLRTVVSGTGKLVRMLSTATGINSDKDELIAPLSRPSSTPRTASNNADCLTIISQTPTIISDAESLISSSVCSASTLGCGSPIADLDLDSMRNAGATVLLDIDIVVCSSVHHLVYILCSMAVGVVVQLAYYTAPIRYRVFHNVEAAASFSTCASEYAIYLMRMVRSALQWCAILFVFVVLIVVIIINNPMQVQRQL
jgi:hypothetical protein